MSGGSRWGVIVLGRCSDQPVRSELRAAHWTVGSLLRLVENKGVRVTLAFSRRGWGVMAASMRKMEEEKQKQRGGRNIRRQTTKLKEVCV